MTVNKRIDKATFAVNASGILHATKDPGIAKALSRIAFWVQRDARRRCPVDTGRLRNSIKVSFGVDHRGLPVAYVGTNVEYAAFVEYGTSKMTAIPYLRPSIVAAMVQFRGRAI